MEFSLIIENQPAPVLELALNGRRSGLGSIDLPKFGVKLDEKVQYRWYVSLVPDPETRSKDVVATGVIEFVQAQASCRNRLNGMTTIERVAAYGAEGMWYDALECAARNYKVQNPDPELNQVLQQLLKDAGLSQVASEILPIFSSTSH